MADLLGVDTAQYTSNQMTYDLRRLRLKGLIYRPHRQEPLLRDAIRVEGSARVLPSRWPRVPTGHRNVHGQRPRSPFPLRRALNRVDDQLDQLIYDALPIQKAR